MRRLIGTVSVLSAMVAAGIAFGQASQAYKPPAGVKMGITLYPETKYRGQSDVVIKDTPRLSRPLEAESLIIIHGIWDLCSDLNYQGHCTRVDASQEGIPVAITVRSVRLVGDQGPGYVPPPMVADDSKPAVSVKQMDKARDRAQLLAEAGISQAAAPRSAPAPVVTPEVAQGGVAGTNPSLRGVGAEFFAAPARNNLRVVACSQGTLNGRCVQATADGFCVERGYVDSAYSGTENVGGRAYLVNVLCKSTADAGLVAAPPAAPAKKRGFLGL